MSEAPRRFSVPGNILLMGEYAVLEEGGLGIAIAVDRRAVVTVEDAASLRIEGRWPGGGILWSRAAPEASPLLAACVDEVSGHLRDAGHAPFPDTTSITIDSTDFFLPDGRKTGLGSSAASTVGVIVALLAAAGALPALEIIRGLAVAAHRRAQGGIGSGYDVSASLQGGVGLFRGGARPSWEPRALPGITTLVGFAGRAAVATTGAVRRYIAWREAQEEMARNFLAASNAVVRSFLAAGTVAEAGQWLEAARKLGVGIGEAVGVPAAIDTPPGLDPAWCKALGAGNEMGVCCAAPAPGASGDWHALPIAREGIRWEA
jgi:phosphomevalonate kinase